MPSRWPSATWACSSAWTAVSRSADAPSAPPGGRRSSSSQGVIALRSLDLPEPCVVTVIDNERVSRRKSNAWRVTRRLEPAEQQCQRYVNHYSRPRVVREGRWTVQGWPVHQSDWKREILRTVVDADAWEAPGDES